MIKYRLKEAFAGEPKGKILETLSETMVIFNWDYKGVDIVLPINSPLLERVVEWKVGQPVIYGGDDKLYTIQSVYDNGDRAYLNDGHHVSTAHLTPAPPLPATPIEYKGVKYDVERKNGVPVYREIDDTEKVVVWNDKISQVMDDSGEIRIIRKRRGYHVCYYILTPIEEPFTLDKKREPETGTNFTLIEAAIRELQAKVKEGKP